MNISTVRAVFAFCLLSIPYQASSAISNLDDDFSFNSAELGPWQFVAGGQALPMVVSWAPFDYVGPQRAYANTTAGLGHTPAVLKVEATPELTIGPADFTVGQVVLHTPGADSFPASFPLSIEWIAPGDGEIVISGEAWLGRNIGRTTAWNVTLNGQLLAGGAFSDGDPWSSNNPFLLADALGTTPLSVNAGKKLAFNFTEAAPGEYVRFNPIVAFTPVPDTLPNGFAIAPLCLLIMLVHRRVAFSVLGGHGKQTC